MNSETKSYNINKLLGTLITIEIALVFIYITDFLTGHPFWTLQLLFDLNGESNIPTWFSSVQLFATGIILFSTAHTMKAVHAHLKWPLILLSLGFTYLSMDETAMLHERLSAVLRNSHIAWRFNGGGNGAWIILYIFLGIIFVITFKQTLILFFRLFKDPSPFFTIGIILYLLGAVGFEILNNQEILSDEKSLLSCVTVSLEEFLEMFGVSLILYGSLLFNRATKDHG